MVATKIKYLVTDCDGVLTDGKYYYFKDGRQFVGYNANDSLAIKIARDVGIECIMISSTTQPEIHALRAKELNIQFISSLHIGKVKALENTMIDFERIAYIGDSMDDIPVFKLVKLSFVPNNVLKEVKLHADFVLTKSGGEGCLLETILILSDKYGKNSNNFGSRKNNRTASSR